MADELVSLDGFALTGPTREGMWKRLDEFEGWFDSPEPRRDSVSRVNGDGIIRSNVYFESRLLTFKGRVTSRNHDYLHEAANRIAALPGRGNKKLVVDGHGPTQWAMVDPRGKVTVAFPMDSRMEFQIPLEAVDSFKYGDSRSFNGSIGTAFDVFHRGTVPAWPIITVTGSLPGGYELTLGGQLVQVTKGLASGSTHTIDMRTGILRENGSRVYGSIGIAEYFTVDPGLPQSFYSVASTTGSGTATVRFYDTYI